MAAHKTWFYSISIALGLVALFGAFIAVRHNAALISALEAAGTVSAAAFAAIAAFGSVRAAAASSASAQRAGEAIARSVRPSLEPTATTVDGVLAAQVACKGYDALDVTVAWTLADGHSVTETVARLDAGGTPLASTLKTEGALAPDQEIEVVWLEYTDEGRVGRWQDTWRMGTKPHDRGRLTLLESRLVD